MKSKAKGFVYVKAQIFIDGESREFAGAVECGLDEIQAEAVRRVVQHYQQQQSKTGAVMEAAVVSGKSQSTIWGYLKKIFAG